MKTALTISITIAIVAVVILYVRHNQSECTCQQQTNQ